VNSTRKSAIARAEPQVRRCVFLDRDGVINKSIVKDGRPYPPASVHDTRLTEGIAEALSILKARGFLLVVVTNQPDVARGTASQDEVERIHDYLRSELPLDAIRSCFHDDSDNCTCRKPRPGLILAAAAEMNIDLSMSFLVGDRWRDIDAGKNAGCKTIFVDYGYQEKLRATPDHVVRSPAEMIQFIN
jgi:D-glycero-D-manno-heptose 1,7-bisphosphate phosphatase